MAVKPMNGFPCASSNTHPCDKYSDEDGSHRNINAVGCISSYSIFSLIFLP